MISEELGREILTAINGLNETLANMSAPKKRGKDTVREELKAKLKENGINFNDKAATTTLQSLWDKHNSR